MYHNFFRRSVKKQSEKNCGKKEGERDEVYNESFGGIAMFMMSAENLWGVLGLRQGWFRIPEEYGAKFCKSA
jgi:hypothetical protein